MESNNIQNKSKSNLVIIILVVVIAALVGIICFVVLNGVVIKNNDETQPSVSIESTKPTIETEPTTQIDYRKEAYVAYLDTINADKDLINCYYLYDIDRDGMEELILEYGEYSAEMECKYYSYKEGAGNVYLGSTGDFVFYDSYENTLIGMSGKMGYYTIYDLSIENGKIVTSVLEEGYTDDEYPTPDGDYLNSFTPDQITILTNTFLK